MENPWAGSQAVSSYQPRGLRQVVYLLWVSVSLSRKWEFCHLHHGVVAGVNKTTCMISFIYCRVCRRYSVIVGISLLLLLERMVLLSFTDFAASLEDALLLFIPTVLAVRRQLTSAAVTHAPQMLLCPQNCVNNKHCLHVLYMCQMFF